MFSPDMDPIMVRPKHASRKYSNELNQRETFASCGAITSSATAEMVPPIMEEIVEIPTALRPFPFFVSGNPSIAVAADAGVPGV